jgi:hypothetical protein
MGRRIAVFRLAAHGNRRGGSYRPEQKDLLAEQLCADPRRRERTAEVVDEIE